MKKIKNNFINSGNINRKKTNKKRKVVIIPLICLTSLVVISVIIYLIYYKPAKNIYTEAIQGKDLFLKAQDQIINQEFDEANNSIVNALKNFNQVKTDFKKFKWLEFVPFLGKQLSAIDNLIETGVYTGEAINKIVIKANDIITPIKKNPDLNLSQLSEEQTRELLEKIYYAKPDLENAKESIDSAAEYINKINEKGLLKKIKNLVAPLKEKVPQLQIAVNKAISLSQIIPPIVGYPEEKTYLFLLQNNSEIRPTGGFIGTYGILKIKDGNITYFKTDNIYNLDTPAEEYLNVEPPWPLTRYNKVFKWLMRDSNWSPDYPTTAQKAEWFYHQERGPEKKIDGVIAVTPTFIESLLDLTGEIKVNDFTFNSNNLVDILQFQVEKGFYRQGLPESERKEVIGSLSKVILNELLSLPKNKWPELWKIINKDISEKQILIYLKDDNIQNLVLENNWGGEVKSYDGDYLLIVDANLASLKSDRKVVRKINYTLSQENDNLFAEISINYDNQNILTDFTTRYRTYTRIYVPKGSELIQSEGAMIDCKISEKGDVNQEEELNKTVFGAFICIEPQEHKSLTFKYQLPEYIQKQIKNGQYKLFVQKQPGTTGHELSVNLNFNKKWTWITPFDKIVKKEDNKIQFLTDLMNDREFDINF